MSTERVPMQLLMCCVHPAAGDGASHQQSSALQSPPPQLHLHCPIQHSRASCCQLVVCCCNHPLECLVLQGRNIRAGALSLHWVCSGTCAYQPLLCCCSNWGCRHKRTACVPASCFVSCSASQPRSSSSAAAAPAPAALQPQRPHNQHAASSLRPAGVTPHVASRTLPDAFKHPWSNARQHVDQVTAEVQMSALVDGLLSNPSKIFEVLGINMETLHYEPYPDHWFQAAVEVRFLQPYERRPAYLAAAGAHSCAQLSAWTEAHVLLGARGAPPANSLASPHLTSPHLTSPHLTTPHHTTPHNTSPHNTSPHLTSQHLTSAHYTTPHHTTPHNTSPHNTSPHLTSQHLTSAHSHPHLTAPLPVLSATGSSSCPRPGCAADSGAG